MSEEEDDEGEGQFILDVEGNQMIHEDGTVYQITEWLDENKYPCLKHKATFAFGRCDGDTWLEVNIRMPKPERLH